MPRRPSQYVKMQDNGVVSIPAALRRKLKIKAGTRIAILEDKGRLVLQPITDEFIDSMHGILRGKGIPSRVDRDPDREL